jgi:serine phosphatase RsbU (regulator of sigma subunit)
MKKTALIILLVTFFFNAKAQVKTVGDAYTQNYPAEVYGASAQNWSIVQDFRGLMYFANTNGVLEYDGSAWRIIKTPANAAVKSLASDQKEKRIYVGAKGDIGYLKPDSKGLITFVSLIKKIPEKYRNFADIWRIHITEDFGVVFEATSGLYFYKNDTFEVIPAKHSKGFKRSFYVNKKLYAYYTGIGLIKIEKDGGFKILPGSEILENRSVNIIIPKENYLIIITDSGGIYEYSNNELIKIEKPELEELIGNDLYFTTELKDGSLALGTLSKGLIITDDSLNIKKIINTSNGLINNRITNIYQDNSNGIWIATSNGISYIDIYSPFSFFYNKTTGISGTIRSIAKSGNMLYIGADAVYAADWEKISNNKTSKFEELKNRKGHCSIWKLDTTSTGIIGGSEKGLFLIENNRIELIDANSERNIRTFICPRENPNVLIAGGGLGLSLFTKENGKWNYKSGIKNFSEYSRHIVQDKNGDFWISEKTKGIFRIRLNKNYDSVISCETFNKSSGLKANIENYLFKAKDELVFCTLNGFYKYDSLTNSMKEFSKLNYFNEKPVADFLYCDEKNNIWIKHIETSPKDSVTKFWSLEKLEIQGDSVSRVIKNRFIPLRNKINSFVSIGGGCYIIGDKDRFVHYDENIKKTFEEPYPAFIRSVETINGDSLVFEGTFTDENLRIVSKQEIPIVLPYEYNGLKFSFSAAYYEYPENISYKFILENNDKDWSDWKKENTKEYSNLWPGTYTFKVKAINNYLCQSTEAEITVKILPPWYLTSWAFVLYAILLILLVKAVVKINIRRLEHEKEVLEKTVSERTAEIVKQKDEILKQNNEIQKRNNVITEKNNAITASIRYAKRIQKAMLPLQNDIAQALPEHFILFRPRDIVSGDFYWFKETPTHIIITAVDCTGHGVPGAFMSMLGAETLTTIVSKGFSSAAEILTKQNEYIRKALKQETNNNQDGMDMALCSIDKKRRVLEFAGAMNPLVYIQNGELKSIKADLQGIGGVQYHENFRFTKHEIPLTETPTWFYIYSDGFEDQFGGKNHKKYMSKNLKKLLLEIHSKPKEKQREILDNTIEEWIHSSPQEDNEQMDDILIIGFCI